jgi:uncharacterized membrane protein
MTNDDLDHLLESHDDIVPSSGFTDAVMAAVRHEAWHTLPLRFPWERAALGPLIAVLVVGLLVVSDVVRPATVGSALSGVVGAGELLTAIGDAASSMRLGWMALALLLTLASVVLSSHLASRLEGHD